LMFSSISIAHAWRRGEALLRRNRPLPAVHFPRRFDRSTPSRNFHFGISGLIQHTPNRHPVIRRVALLAAIAMARGPGRPLGVDVSGPPRYVHVASDNAAHRSDSVPAGRRRRPGEGRRDRWWKG